MWIEFIEYMSFELNYWNKWTFPRHSNLLRCTCIHIRSESTVFWTFTQKSGGDSISPLDLQKLFVKVFQHCIKYWWTHYFYLNYHSVGYLTMYYVLLKGFKLIQILVISYLQIFSNFLSSEPLSSDIFTLKGWSISKTVTTTSPFELNFQHHNFADVLYSQTATLHTNESLKSEIIINDPFKYPRYFKINILIIITFACSRFSDIG